MTSRKLLAFGPALVAGLVAMPRAPLAQEAPSRPNIIIIEPSQQTARPQLPGQTPSQQAQPGMQQAQPGAQQAQPQAPPGAQRQRAVQQPGELGGERSGQRANDASVATDVIERLTAARLDGRDVRVSVSNEMVTLRGTVPSEQVRQQVVQVAAQTKYVKGVVDQLTVQGQQPAPMRPPGGSESPMAPQPQPQTPGPMIPAPGGQTLPPSE